MARPRAGTMLVMRVAARLVLLRTAVARGLNGEAEHADEDGRAELARPCSWF